MRALIAFFLVLLLAMPAIAEPTQQSEIVEHNGVQGMWFPMDTARRLLAEVEEGQSLRLQIQLLNQKLELKEETLTLLQQNVSLSEQQATQWRNALNESLKVNVRSHTIWDSSEFWFFTGFASAAVLSIGLSFGLSEAGH